MPPDERTRALRASDHTNVWHPFTPMSVWLEDDAPIGLGSVANNHNRQASAHFGQREQVFDAVEFRERRERLLEQVRGVGGTGYALFDPSYVHYFTGFWFLSNERPIVYMQNAEGADAIFVPEFEVERTSAEASFNS